MDHVAIMKKSWNLIPKILDGSKKIESRWSVNRVSPWGKVKRGDTVYFKNSGELITFSANVSLVKSFEGLTPKKVKEIVSDYGGKGKAAFNSFEDTYEWAKNKKYCTLIYLKEVNEVTPFNIDKKGFGIGAAWLSTKDINLIRAD